MSNGLIASLDFSTSVRREYHRLIEEDTNLAESKRPVREQARLFDLITDAILVRDVADRITFWNQGASRLYGFTREAEGRMSHDLLGTEFLQPLQEIEDELASDGDGLVSSDTPALTERDAQRKHHSILESNRDINESKRAQEE